MKLYKKLNFEASKFGYKFNKGSSDKQRGYFALDCKYKRKKSLSSKYSKNQSKNLDGSEAESEDDKNSNSLMSSCSAYNPPNKICFLNFFSFFLIISLIVRGF